MTSLDWGDAIPAIVGAIGILLIPGLAIGLAFGVRGTTLITLTPMAALSVLGVTSVVRTVFPFDWGVIPVVVVGAVLVALVLLVRRLTRSSWHPNLVPEAASHLWILGGSALAAAVLIGARFMAIFGGPGHISQTFDNVFHLNAIRYILDTGDASPLHIGSLTYDIDHNTAYYPDLWHAFVALVAQVSGTSIPVAVNAANIVIAGVVWPLGCLLLARAVFGRRRIALAITGVLSAAFGAFPYLMVEFGVLYPNLLSIALLPGVLALVVFAAGLGTQRPTGRLVAWLLVVAAIPSLALAHPSTLIALIGFSVPVAIIAVYRLLRSLRAAGAPRSRFVLVWMLTALGFIAGAGLFLKARPPMWAAFWGPWTNVFDGAWQAVSSSTMWMVVDATITVFTILGVVAIIITRRHLWLLGSFGVAVILYAVAAGVPVSVFRYVMIGTWYSDANRLASLVPVLALPVAVVGAVWLFDLASAGIRRATRDRSARVARIVIAAIAVVLVAGTAVLTQTGEHLAQRTAAAQPLYRLTPDAPLLSSDEATLLERVPEHVPEGVVVAGSPWTGASLVYAVADRRALLPAIFGDRTKDTLALMEGLHDAASGDEVCAAIQRENVGFVLDFGLKEVHPGEHPMPGFEDLEDSGAVRLVDSEGPARLFEVTACR